MLSQTNQVYMTVSKMKGLKAWKKFETLLCAAADTASHWHGSEACTAYGRYGTVSKIYKAVLKLYSLN
jgi:hypothetical protein